MKSKHEIGKELEKYIAMQFRCNIDSNTKLSKGSGNKGTLGDINNKYCVIEAKVRNTKDFTIKEDVWKKLNNSIPLHSERFPVYIIQNKNKERLAILHFDQFVQLLKGYLQNE